MINKILSTVTVYSSFIFFAVGQSGYAQQTQQSQQPQQPQRVQETTQRLVVGVDFGTLGPGITLATELSPHFKLRGGVNFLRYKYKDQSFTADMFDPNDPTKAITEQDVAGVVNEPKLSFTNGKLIVDYYPAENGIFSISAGLYAGVNNITGDAKMTGNNFVPGHAFDYEGVYVKPKTDGTFDAKVKIGNVVKPYFGIGLGRTVPNRRLAVKIDLGLIYQGDYKITSDDVHGGKGWTEAAGKKVLADADIPDWMSDWAFKFWPVVSVGLSYRLF